MRVISQYIASENNAGPKAKVDIERILNKEYGAEIYTNKVKEFEEKAIKYKIKKMLFSNIHLRTKDLIVIQIPFSNKTKILNLANNKIGLVHDLDGIRFQNEALLKKEIECLNMYRYLIVHNNVMKEYLINHGLKIPVVTIDLFDYLIEDSTDNNNNEVFDPKNPIVIYPGNLEKRKANFIYSLNESKMNFKLNVYGSNFEKQEINNKKIEYKGSYPPDIIPNKLEGNLGLVWSGELDESDENLNEKGYNKFNTPHKLSCYLAAGIPVIIWSKAASCEIIDKYNVGYKINDLYEINNINFDDYEEKRKNAQELSKKIRKGYFTKSAFDKIMEML